MIPGLWFPAPPGMVGPGLRVTRPPPPPHGMVGPWEGAGGGGPEGTNVDSCSVGFRFVFPFVSAALCLPFGLASLRA